MPHILASLVAVALIVVTGPAPAQAPFVNFESPVVRPLRLSPDGSRLAAVNTSDNRLVVWSLADPDRPVLLAEIPVGLEPVSVHPRTNDEYWVVNHLSDSVSVVSLDAGAVVATLRVKDEPSDVVFAAGRAFVSAAASDEVRVFDATTRAPVGAIPVFGKHPRALAVNPAGTRVYAVIERSGNGTTLIRASAAGPPPAPATPGLPAAPQQGLIVLATNSFWAFQIPYTLPDNDVVEIDAVSLAVTRSFSGAGTTNTGIAVHPATGDLWVTNIDSRNLVRFEPGVRGHAIDSRVTRITTGAVPSVNPIDLNPGIAYGVFPNGAALATVLAEPQAVEIDAGAGRLYVAAQGSDRIGVLDLSGIVQGRIEIGGTPSALVNTPAKRGPRALALRAQTNRLYVLNKLSATLSVVDLSAGAVQAEIPLGTSDPEPPALRLGRKFLYDTKLSGNGTMSCASCHIDGDMDGLAWDLGDPGGQLQAPPAQPFPFNLGITSFHPMKGPLVTQSFKGLGGVSPFHWRGDRADFQAFNGAFASLLGGSPLSTADMNLYAAFATSIAYPPNPNQPLDRSYLTTPASANQQAGFNAFTTPIASIVNLGFVSCSSCHALPLTTNRMLISTQVSNAPQQMKVPHLRNLYQKTGFNRVAAPQKSGFGFSPDGGFDTLTAFLDQPRFAQWPPPVKDDLVAFLLAADTGTAPTVGYQATLNQATAGAASTATDLALLAARAQAGDIDLVAKGTVLGEARSFLYAPATQVFVPDVSVWSAFPLAALTQLAQAGSVNLTFTGVPPGSGARIGTDRDLDGTLDGDEGVFRYGAGTAGCSGVPFLDANSEPRIGNTLFAVTCKSAPPGAFGLLAVGAAQAAIPYNGITILVDLSPQASFLAALVADTAGWTAVPAAIPADPSIVGLVFHLQAAWIDVCAPQGISASRGLRISIRP